MKQLYTLLLSLPVLGCSPDISLEYPEYPEDNIIEETIESIVEETIEDKLNLPEGSLKDKIDFSIGSEEDQDS